MDAVEVFYTFYGALLALAASRLLAGAARLVAHRKTVRIGWMTPLLALLLVFDLAACATNGWRALGSADMSLRLVLDCLLAAGAYYMAASLITPETLSDDLDLDVWYRENKRYVVGGMLAGNVLGFEVMQIIVKGLEETVNTRWTGFNALMNLVYYVLLVVLMLMRNRATDIILLVVLNALYLISIVSF